MKKIYFVRHGESEGNLLKVHQSPQTPLTEIGLSQAKIVALRFSKIQASLIIASPCLRAQQTAQAIADKNNLQIITNDLFTEKRGPSELVGLSQNSQQSKTIRNEIAQHFLDQEGQWQHSDEETATGFANRAKQALKFLSQRPEESLIVVCHSLVLHMIFATILSQGQNLKLEDLYGIYENFKINNTSISAAIYNEETQRWSVDCLNDYSHLG